MIIEIDRALKEEGYQYRKISMQEAGVYYRCIGERMQVVLGIYAHDAFELEGEQYEKLIEHLRGLFEDMREKEDACFKGAQIREAEILTLIVTNRPERFRELYAGYEGIWILEQNTGRLLIYENQPIDFYGLDELIRRAGERLLQRKEEERKRKKVFVPFVSIGFVAANIFVFLVCSLLGDPEDAIFMLDHGAMYPDSVLAGREWHRVFTCMFLHFGIDHLANNMIMLFFAGRYLEKALGHVRFLCLYLLTGVASSMFSLFMMVGMDDAAVSAGASGAVFGIVGGLFGAVLKNKGRIEDLSARGIFFMAALSLYYGFSSAGVDNWGHVGGLVCGVVLGILLYKKGGFPKEDSDNRAACLND